MLVSIIYHRRNSQFMVFSTFPNLKNDTTSTRASYIHLVLSGYRSSSYFGKNNTAFGLKEAAWKLLNCSLLAPWVMNLIAARKSLFDIELSSLASYPNNVFFSFFVIIDTIHTIGCRVYRSCISLKLYLKLTPSIIINCNLIA